MLYQVVLDAPLRRAEFDHGRNLNGRDVSEHGLKRVVMVNFAGIKLLDQAGISDHITVCVVGLVARKGACVLLDMLERAQAKADDLVNAPGPQREQIMLVAPELGARADFTAGKTKSARYVLTKLGLVAVIQEGNEPNQRLFNLFAAQDLEKLLTDDPGSCRDRGVGRVQDG